MKHLCLVLALGLSLGLFSSCNHQAAQKDASSTEPQTIKIDMSSLASNKDYACGMTLEAGNIGDTASFEGKTYGFCSKECKMEFLKDPQSYLTKK